LDPYRSVTPPRSWLNAGSAPKNDSGVRWESVLDSCIEIRYGKSDNARRSIPISNRVGTPAKANAVTGGKPNGIPG